MGPRFQTIVVERIRSTDCQAAPKPPTFRETDLNSICMLRESELEGGARQPSVAERES
jgi:hypothetical protein